MSDLALLLLLGIIVALWLDGRRVQEIAVERCRAACAKAGVQFLDDIAPAWGLRLARDASGIMRLKRTFTFEYSTPEGERRSGSIVMLGRVPVALQLAESEAANAQNPDNFYP